MSNSNLNQLSSSTPQIAQDNTTQQSGDNLQEQKQAGSLPSVYNIGPERPERGHFHHNLSYQKPGIGMMESQKNGEKTLDVTTDDNTEKECGTDKCDFSQYKYEQVVKEPEAIRFKAKWMEYNALVFNMTMMWTYRVLTIILSFPLSFIWGLTFGILTLTYVWIIKPLAKICRNLILLVEKVIGACVRAIVEPCYLAMGALFSRITITHVNRRLSASKAITEC